MKSSINRQQLVLEFVSVVFAVLLALLLNNWRENIKSQNAADRVLESIKEEILKNDELLRTSLDYRTELLTHLYSMIYRRELGVTAVIEDMRNYEESIISLHDELLEIL